jgi:hypothetical protein
MKSIWLVLALAFIGEATLVVSASSEDDTVWGGQERPVVSSTEEDFIIEKENKGQTSVNEDELAEDID